MHVSPMFVPPKLLRIEFFLSRQLGGTVSRFSFGKIDRFRGRYPKRIVIRLLDWGNKIAPCAIEVNSLNSLIVGLEFFKNRDECGRSALAATIRLELETRRESARLGRRLRELINSTLKESTYLPNRSVVLERRNGTFNLLGKQQIYNLIKQSVVADSVYVSVFKFRHPFTHKDVLVPCYA